MSCQSDSSDSEEELKLLKQAVDTNFLNDKLLKNDNDSNEYPCDLVNKPKLPSQRCLDADITQPDLHLTIPPTMQDFFYRKLSSMVDNSVEFVDNPIPPPLLKKSRITKSNVKLLNDTEPIIMNSENDVIKRMKRVKIKRRFIHGNEQLQTEAEKISEASIEWSDLMNFQKSVDKWMRKPKPEKLYSYKHKSGMFYLIEPVNEFTRSRNKNNWTERKISISKHNC